MAEQSPLRLIKRSAEYISVEDVVNMPRGIRGIYVLYKHIPRSDKYDVVYVGMTTAGEGGGIKRRLKSHKNRKSGLWTHCSIFEVWDNIRDDEIVELEGLFRHIYHHDSKANSLNIQRGFKKLAQVRDNKIENWKIQNGR